MFEWACKFEELHKICTLFNLTEIENPQKFCYKPLKEYIQEGPQCGLVALAIACENPNKEFIENIFEFAKKHQYTYNGEIFSSKYMENLATVYLSDKYKSFVFNGKFNSFETKEHLLHGGLILVPYPFKENRIIFFHE